MVTSTTPLAALLRPTSLAGIVGQPDASQTIRRYIDAGRVPSMVFWGPPGTGKTSMATVIASEIDAHFHKLSGVTSTKKQLMEIIAHAQTAADYGRRTIVFLDEIHRRTKAQQDTLLPYVEDGTIILIGATTENPSFTINNALLSRCEVVVFGQIDAETIMQTIAQYKEEIIHRYPSAIYDEQIVQLIAYKADGDMRRALTILEGAILATPEAEAITPDRITRGMLLQHDRDGDSHYDIISAIHKSLRDSDHDAACYRVQRMLSGGDDPLYVARRLLRFASEDIGLANNNALLLANTVYETVQKLGMPECDTALMQLTIYLAQSPKSNTCYRVAKQTKDDITTHGSLPVPLVIRNAPTQLMRDTGYGEGYIYAHDDPDGAATQQHMPDELKNRSYGIE